MFTKADGLYELPHVAEDNVRFPHRKLVQFEIRQVDDWYDRVWDWYRSEWERQLDTITELRQQVISAGGVDRQQLAYSIGREVDRLGGVTDEIAKAACVTSFLAGQRAGLRLGLRTMLNALNGQNQQSSVMDLLRAFADDHQADTLIARLYGHQGAIEFTGQLAASAEPVDTTNQPTGEQVAGIRRCAEALYEAGQVELALVLHHALKDVAAGKLQLPDTRKGMPSEA